MRPDAAGSPTEWLRFTERDLAIARVRVSDAVLLEALCNHAQQAVEKALKAVLVHFDQNIIRTHSIESLMMLVGEHAKVPAEFENAVDLTTYAVGARYPGGYEPVSETEYKEAVMLADKIVAWAKTVIAPAVD